MVWLEIRKLVFDYPLLSGELVGMLKHNNIASSVKILMFPLLVTLLTGGIKNKAYDIGMAGG